MRASVAAQKISRVKRSSCTRFFLLDENLRLLLCGARQWRAQLGSQSLALQEVVAAQHVRWAHCAAYPRADAALDALARALPKDATVEAEPLVLGHLANAVAVLVHGDAAALESRSEMLTPQKTIRSSSS